MRTQLLLITFFLTALFSSCLRDKNKLTILFDRVDGLETDAKVYQKGIIIGKVTDLHLVDKGVLADIQFKDNVRIPVDSKFTISTSLLGTTSISVEPSNNKSYLTLKDTIAGHYNDKKLLDDLVSDSAKQQKIQKSLDKIADGVKELVETAKDTTDKK